MSRETEYKILKAVRRAIKKDLDGLYRENSDNFILTLTQAEALEFLKRENELSLAASYNAESAE